MKKRLLLIGAALVFGVVGAVTACTEEPQPSPQKTDGGGDPGQYTDHTGEITNATNRAVYNLMRELYYWNDAVKRVESVPQTYDPSEFLTGLIENLDWASVQDASNGENPPTIDGVWNADRTERTHIYSFISQIGGTRSTRAASSEVTFGFDFEMFDADFKPIVYANYARYAVVSWTQPGGPAEQAGLKRGTIIDKYAYGNGSPATIGMAQYEQLFTQINAAAASPNRMALVDNKGQSYVVTSGTMKVSPIIAHNVVWSPGGAKAGYFAYTSFERGDDGEFDNEMRQAFAGFKNSGVQELVIDLRYNGGGYVSSSQLLASLAGNVDGSQIFGKLYRNPGAVDFLATYYGQHMDNPEILYFNDEPAAYRLGLNRVYVLATKSSASASELVINALRGVDVEVVVIGGETNGKNVGMDVMRFPVGGNTYEFAPITFKNLNARDFCNYAAGFAPDYRIDEFRGLNASGGVYELGNANEELLKAALVHIDGGQPAVDVPTRSLVREYGVGGVLEKPVRGAIMHELELL